MSRLSATVASERASILGLPLARYILPGSVAAVVFWLAYDGGAFDLTSRSTLAIALWWTLAAAVVLSLWPLTRLTFASLAAAGALAAFAVVTLVSSAWGSSAEVAFEEFDRVLLYLGVLLVTVLAARRGEAGRWADGLALAIAAIGVLALASRFFPGLASVDRQAHEFLPQTRSRLSFPLDYWNGLGIFVALSFPLLLRASLNARHAVTRALALAPVPALAGAIYLTSSRGGVGTALIGVVVFVALTHRRVEAVVSLAIAGLGAVAAVIVLRGRPELVNEPASAAAETQGRSAALLFVVICAAAAAAHLVVTRLLPRGLVASRATERAILALGAVVLVVAIVAADPVQRVRDFKAVPGQSPPGQPAAPEDEDFVATHLLSGGGSGRWQQWDAAVESFESRPLLGRGAGSYESYWAQHGSLVGFVRDAHSLYLETLGELGLVGFALIAAFFAVALGAAARRVLGGAADDRVTVAALCACLLAYMAAAGIDWMWEMTVVSVVGMVLVGLLTGRATLARADRTVETRLDPRRFRIAAAVVLALSAAVIYSQAVPLLADLRLEESRRAAARGDVEAALDHALAARDVEPWASSPYVQLALVEEGRGDFAAARGWVAEAIERDPGNWRVWYVSARIHLKLDLIPAAAERLRRARELNPRSPLFGGGGA